MYVFLVSLTAKATGRNGRNRGRGRGRDDACRKLATNRIEIALVGSRPSGSKHNGDHACRIADTILPQSVDLRNEVGPCLQFNKKRPAVEAAGLWSQERSRNRSSLRVEGRGIRRDRCHRCPGRCPDAALLPRFLRSKAWRQAVRHEDRQPQNIDHCRFPSSSSSKSTGE